MTTSPYSRGLAEQQRHRERVADLFGRAAEPLSAIRARLEHWCSAPGCREWGSFSPDGGQTWTCRRHAGWLCRALALALVILALSPAAAHDWYPPSCCSGADCRVAEPGEIVEAPGGWRVVPTGEFYPYAKAGTSPDGKFHRCLRNPRDIKSPTICVFVVVGGS